MTAWIDRPGRGPSWQRTDENTDEETTMKNAKTSGARKALTVGALAAALLTATLAGTANATEVGLQRRIGVGLVAGSAPGLTVRPIRTMRKREKQLTRA